MKKERRKNSVLLAEPMKGRSSCWRRFFLEKGYVVLEARTGQECIYFVQTYQVDVVVLGSTLPDMGGAQLLKEIAFRQRNLPTFLVSGQGPGRHVRFLRPRRTDPQSEPAEPPSSLRWIAQRLEACEGSLASANGQKPAGFDRMICESEAMNRVVQQARVIAHSDIHSMVLEGESGVGKDVLAQAIHRESARWQSPFVRVVCSALPETLLESELFGHEKGAFTDAKTQKQGLFELAAGGTVLLDEVGEISHAVQVKLLSVLESRTFRRVGGTADIPFSARVIAATNANLARAVRKNRFREDLYYRLAVARLVLPPLRDRHEDISPLARQILRDLCHKHGQEKKRLTPCALRRLESHTWPGNIRELKNVLERALAFCQGTDIRGDDIELIEDDSSHGIGLNGELNGELNGTHRDKCTRHPLVASSRFSPHLKFELPFDGVCLPDLVAELERSLITQALDLKHGNQVRAARLLGLSRDQIVYRIKKYLA